MYLFDEQIKNILFKYILQIENSFKSSLTYLISEKYGVHEDHYLKLDNYSKSSKFTPNILYDLHKEIIRGRNNPIKFYRDGDPVLNKLPKNHVPPWIAIHDLSFNDVIRWYSALNNFDKKEIINSFFNFKNNWNENDKEIQFFQSLNLIRKYRNKCAHGAPAINVTIENYGLSKKIMDKLKPGLISKRVGLNDYKAILIAITILHDNPNLLAKMYKEILNVYGMYDNQFLKYPVQISSMDQADYEKIINFATELYD